MGRWLELDILGLMLGFRLGELVGVSFGSSRLGLILGKRRFGFSRPGGVGLMAWVLVSW